MFAAASGNRERPPFTFKGISPLSLYVSTSGSYSGPVKPKLEATAFRAVSG